MYVQGLSGYVSERAKYLEYREQPDRIAVNGQQAVFRGKHRDHHLVRQPDGWLCDCETYSSRGWCSHAEAVNWIERHELWAQDQT